MRAPREFKKEPSALGHNALCFVLALILTFLAVSATALRWTDQAESWDTVCTVEEINSSGNIVVHYPPDGIEVNGRSWLTNWARRRGVAGSEETCVRDKKGELQCFPLLYCTFVGYGSSGYTVVVWDLKRTRRNLQILVITLGAVSVLFYLLTLCIWGDGMIKLRLPLTAFPIAAVAGSLWIGLQNWEPVNFGRIMALLCFVLGISIPALIVCVPLACGCASDALEPCCTEADHELLRERERTRGGVTSPSYHAKDLYDMEAYYNPDFRTASTKDTFDHPDKPKTYYGTPKDVR